MKRMIVAALCGLAGLCAAVLPARAQSPETQKAVADAQAAAVEGPADVPLAAQAVLKLPAGHAFIPQPQAGRLLNAMGNPGERPRLQGVVFPEGGGWFVVVEYEAAGYVKDDDAKEWNATELLDSYKEGTAQANEERVRMGVPELEIVGWAEPPKYNADTHRLVWAMSSRHKGEAPGAVQGVNYNTYALGRDGYFSLNLVTDMEHLPANKDAAIALLDALRYNDGKRYADFNPSTDKVAEYGLAALVLGVGAKKLGLLAMAGVFLAKFAKVILLALAGIGTVGVKLLRRRKSDDQAAAT